jgi:hydroxyacylglutathione hydrolase
MTLKKGLTITQHDREPVIKGLAVAIIYILPFLISCTVAPTQKKGQNNIDPAGLVAMVKETNAVVIDTMSYLECMDHRIPGSQCIPLEELDKKLPAAIPQKEQPLVFYCESEKCPRAPLAYEKAKLLGYGNIYVLEGGLVAWKKAGHEVETIQRVKRAPVVSIKSEKLQTLLKERRALFILDVRSEDTFKANHIEGAINIPFYTLHKKLREIPKNVPVIVVDENGKRSFLACCYLINKGVIDVTRLFGGMESLDRKEGNKDRT